MLMKKREESLKTLKSNENWIDLNRNTLKWTELDLIKLNTTKNETLKTIFRKQSKYNWIKIN